MSALSFQYDRLTFFRETPSRVIHLMGLGFGRWTMEAFHVMCGVCTREIPFYMNRHPRDMAYIGCQHLTKNGWDRNSGQWPCSDEQAARASLSEIGELVPKIIEPWFQKITTLSSVAALMDGNHPRQGIEKAKLFLADGSRAEAVATLRAYLAVLAKPRPWHDSKEIATDKEQAESLLRQIEAA